VFEFDLIVRELRHAIRRLRARPAFTAVVVLTLALGIGANTAIFSLIYALLLRPFPYASPDRLVRVRSVLTNTSAVRGGSLRDVEDWRLRARTLSHIGAFTTFDSDIRGGGPAIPVRMAQLNPPALDALGVQPLVGRLFRAEEDLPGGDVHKAIISHGLWQRRFGGARDIVGRPIRTPQTTLTIVGVMPEGFGFPDHVDLWTPMESYYALATGGPQQGKPRTARNYGVIARLADGATLDQAQAEMERISADLERDYPKENEGVRARLMTLRDAESGDVRPYLWLLGGAVSFVLLICCANVANMFLARGSSLHRDLSIRLALGASRGAVIRGIVVESLVLSVTGAVLGVALASVALRALMALIPGPLPSWVRVAIDSPVLAFSIGLALLTAIVFSLAPAAQALRLDLTSALKGGTRGATGRSRSRGMLVVAEVAASILLLIGAGLMMQSFLRLNRMDTGFAQDGLLVARVSNFQPGTRAQRAAVLTGFHDRVLAAIRAIPGVQAAGASNGLPYVSPYQNNTNIRASYDLVLRGRSEAELKQAPGIAVADVTPGYMEALRIPLLSGRLFDRRDTSDSPMVVVISERAAERLWPGQDPLGQEVRLGAPGADNPYCRVVGVGANIRHEAAEGERGLEFYYPSTQYPISSAYYVIRAAGDPASLSAAVRRAIQSIDTNAAVIFTKPMAQLMEESLWQRRLWGVLFLAFAVIALTLASIGIYGVTSYAVSQRTREIGLRIALGAGRRGVLALIVGQAMTLVILGLIVGLAGALASTALLRHLLFGVSAVDPLTFIVTSAILLLVALTASYLPARRAAKVDPLIALRD
jgi:putative ABC transport system permease protein